MLKKVWLQRAATYNEQFLLRHFARCKMNPVCATVFNHQPWTAPVFSLREFVHNFCKFKFSFSYRLFKFHCTYGETKKLVSSAVKDLKTAIELKFSVKDPFLIKLYVTEVEDYIEWDSDSELMVAAEPSSKIWKVVIEK